MYIMDTFHLSPKGSDFSDKNPVRLFSGSNGSKASEISYTRYMIYIYKKRK